jgi:hypothetical protein
MREHDTGDWRKFHNEELQNWASSFIKIQVMNSMNTNLAGDVARISKVGNSYTAIV